jgi:metal-responsive CopG/Arc/MetJ family transcriptional regulator
VRTIVEIPRDQLAELDVLCRRQGISRAEAIRRAVAAMLVEQGRGHSQAAFGLWKDRGDELEATLEAVRDEWR